MNKDKIIKGYKGFDKDMKCRGLQYKIGKEMVEDKAKICDCGLHFCENPHDVFRYYGAGNGNKFSVVEAKDVSDERGDDSKRVAKRLTVKAEISVFEICKIAVIAFFENFGFKEKIKKADSNNAGDYGAANAGDCGAANAGDCGAANAGDCGAANAGDCGAANAGYKGAANAGYKGAANAGDCGAANAGYKGAANAGDFGAANAGDCGAAIVSNNGCVKGGMGCVLVARNIKWNDDNNCYEVTDWAAEIVDGDKRVLLINGHVVPYALARIPQQGEVRGNLAAGGVGRAQPLTPGDRRIAEALAPVLAQEGHFLVGLDIIGEWLTEINVTSPTCFREITQQTGFNVAGLFMDELEKAV